MSLGVVEVPGRWRTDVDPSQRDTSAVNIHQINGDGPEPSERLPVKPRRALSHLAVSLSRACRDASVQRSVACASAPIPVPWFELRTGYVPSRCCCGTVNTVRLFAERKSPRITQGPESGWRASLRLRSLVAGPDQRCQSRISVNATQASAPRSRWGICFRSPQMAALTLSGCFVAVLVSTHVSRPGTGRDSLQTSCNWAGH